MTGLAQSRLAMCMKNMRTNQVPEYASNQHIGGEVFPTQEASCRYGGRSPVCQEPYPLARILMSDHTRHGPREHGVSGREGSVQASVTPEPAVPCSFFRTFTACRELHWSVDQESVGDGLQGKFARLFGVPVACFDTVGPKPDQRRTGRIKANIWDVPAGVPMIGRQCSAELPVGRDQS